MKEENYERFTSLEIFIFILSGARAHSNGYVNQRHLSLLPYWRDLVLLQRTKLKRKKLPFISLW
jgi:hypothetical protein